MTAANHENRTIETVPAGAVSSSEENHMSTTVKHKLGDVVTLDGVQHTLAAHGPRARSFWSQAGDRMFEVDPSAGEVLGEYVGDDIRYPGFLMREILQPVADAETAETHQPSAWTLARRTGITKRNVDAFLDEAVKRHWALIRGVGYRKAAAPMLTSRGWAFLEGREAA